MEIKFLFRTKTVLVLLLIVSVLVIAALLSYTRIDNVINIDLYKYGLQLSNEWISVYWSSYSFFLSSIESSLILVCATIMIQFTYSRETNALSRWMRILLPLIAAGFILLSSYFVLSIDKLVNNTLYQYELQFSSVWAESYYSIAWTTLTLMTGSIALLVGISIIIWIITKWQIKAL